MNPRIPIALGFAVALFAAPLAHPQEKDPKYPHVNLATVWTVDAKWPQRPADMTWGHVPGIAVEAVDSLGAGDAFVAGLLACLSAYSDRNDVCAEATLVPALHFANAVGAITTTRYGAIPALPTRTQVEALLDARTSV